MFYCVKGLHEVYEAVAYPFALPPSLLNYEHQYLCLPISHSILELLHQTATIAPSNNGLKL